jgi:hypothetical protein
MSDLDSSGKLSLAQRIDRFVKGLERAKRAPNRRESHHVVAALRCLHDGRYEEGRLAMINAERVAPLPPEAANLVKSNEPESVPELRAALDAILAGSGQRQG